VSCIGVYICRPDDEFDPVAAVLSAARIYAAANAMSLPPDLSYTKDTLGKPYFAVVPELHFSLSHSGDYWLCAFATFTLGLDLQKHESCRMDALAKRFFHTLEYQYLEDAGYGDFFAIWTAKESYVKYTGQGIDDDFGNFSVIGKNGISSELDGAQLRFLPFYPGYTVCICAADINGVTMALFEPQSGLYQTVSPSDFSD